MMKSKAMAVAAGLSCLLVAPLANAGEWFGCGWASQIPNGGCWLPAYPPERFEYAVKYMTHTPVPVVCSEWSLGQRLHSVTPYILSGNDPTAAPYMVGVMFYRQTLAQDDDVCAGGLWRHKFWHYDAANRVTMHPESHGCRDVQILCRAF
jgi:hypothetical protein